MLDETVIMTRRYVVVQHDSDQFVTHAWGPFDNEESALMFSPPLGTDDRGECRIIPLLQPAIWSELENLPAAEGIGE